ncbi:MAG: hypothetical protein M1826_000338 [Phylliscum demangeonii]|nr:MAG: hypothetical protein M1826_000338 [Phylliscum demangeonii]
MFRTISRARNEAWYNNKSGFNPYSKGRRRRATGDAEKDGISSTLALVADGDPGRSQQDQLDAINPVKPAAGQNQRESPERKSASGKPTIRERLVSKLGRHGEASDGESGVGKATQQSAGKERRYTLGNQLKETVFNSWINVLLIAVPTGIALNYAHVNPVVIFVVNFIAIVPLAGLLSYATEEIALRVGETLGGLLNATFGNAVELIVAILALVKNEVLIVQTRPKQHFNMVVAQTASSLLTLSVGSLVIPTAFRAWSSAGDVGIAPLSRGTAIILLVVYGCYLFFQLHSHADEFNKTSKKVEKRKKEKGSALKGMVQVGATMACSVHGHDLGVKWDQKHDDDDDHDGEPRLSVLTSVLVLAISTTLVALCAEYLVSSIGAITQSGHVSKTFIGLILLPIVGNAAEHATAVTVAMKDKMDLAIGVAVGSSMQIALLVLPLLVTLGWILHNDQMTLYFDGFQVAVLFITVLLINYIVQDGESHWLEGVLLMAAYVIIALAAWYYPSKGNVVG